MEHQPQTVILIGGSGSLGQALAPAFIRDGYHVIIADISEPETIPAGASLAYLDASDHESLETFKAMLKEKDVDVRHVVNTVGGLAETGLTSIMQTSADEIGKTIRLNLMTQILPVKYLGQYMAERRTREDNTGLDAVDRSFVLTSSINAQQGYSIAFYSAAKGGIESFIRPAAMDIGRHGIRINAVSPGSVVTPETASQPKDFNARARAAALGRLCTVEEIADSIRSLTNLTGITGQTITVDAGQSINPAQSLFQQEAEGLITLPGSAAEKEAEELAYTRPG